MMRTVGLFAAAAATTAAVEVHDNRDNDCDSPYFAAGPDAEASDFEDWSVDTHSFASAAFDPGPGAMRLRGGFFPGTSSLMFYGNTADHNGDSNCDNTDFMVKVSMYSRHLENNDACTFDVSFDGGLTWSDPLVELEAGDSEAASVSYTVPLTEDVDYLLRLSLTASDFWDFCFLESVYAGPFFTTSTSTTSTSTSTTSTTTTTSTSTTNTPPAAADCDIPLQLFATNFANAAEVAEWSGAGTFARGGLQMATGGAATYTVDMDSSIRQYESVQAFALLQGVGLSAGDSCDVFVSFDGQTTSAGTLVSVSSAQTSVVGGNALFKAAEEPSWDGDVDVVLVANIGSSSSGKCVLHAVGVSGHLDCDSCPSTCGGLSCDDWLDTQPQMTCEELELHDCECAGCACGSTTSTSSTSSSSTSSSSSSSTTTTSDPCHANCMGFSCDYLVQTLQYTCHTLEQYNCDCSGCECEAEVCPNTCHGYTCDFWGVDDFTTCAEAEEAGCDCSGCACVLDVVDDEENDEEITTTSTSTTSTTSSVTEEPSTEEPTTEEPTTEEPTTEEPTTEETQPPSTATPCPATCIDGHDCDHWVQRGYSCATLEAYSCSCGGCGCVRPE